MYELVLAHGEAKEMFRIQGVYMYSINPCEKVAAFVGFKTFCLYMYESPMDLHVARAFLKIDRWIYPLMRSFSPVYVWSYDKLIFPCPFTSYLNPQFIVVRLPMGMSEDQRASLYNLLDVNADLWGCFENPSQKEIIKRTPLFHLTEINDCEREKMKECGRSQESHPAIKLIEDVFRLRPIKSARLTKGSQSVYLKNGKLLFAKDMETLCDKAPVIHTEESYLEKYKEVKDNSHWNDPRTELAPRTSVVLENTKFGFFDTCVIPKSRRNLTRLYIIGPRDSEHIEICFAPIAFKMSNTLRKGVHLALQGLVKQREEKERLGVPPNMNKSRNKHVCERDAVATYAVIPARPDKVKRNLPPKANKSPKYLESAALIFDKALASGHLELVDYEQGDYDKTLVNCIVPYILKTTYTFNPTIFGLYHGLTMTYPHETDYAYHTNHLRRIHEECLHHYPKLRPTNPYLDPKYTYARRIPFYHCGEFRS